MKTSIRTLFAALVLFVSVLVVLAGSGAPLASAQDQAPPITPQATTKPSSQPFAPGQILIRFRPSVSTKRVDQLLAERGLSRIRRLPALDVHVLRLPPALSVEQAVEIFKHLPEVEFAEPNYIVHLAQINDPGLANQWAPQKIGAPQAWLTTEGDPAVVIAVVDTGVDYRHSELAPNMWVNSGEIPNNGLDDDGNGYSDDLHGWDFVNNDHDPLDDHFHGTHVAGIAAAAPTANPAGIVGICPRCHIMAVKVVGADGSGTLDTLANGITYAADNGARVINMSLGASTGSATLESAVNYAWSRGLVVVAAAGNDGVDGRLYPAAYPNVMAVASTNSSDYRSCFSNLGDGYVSVAAPGELIYSTTLVDSSGNDTYAVASGTSMATPHVAGLAGLLFSQNPARTNVEVRNLIQATTNDLGPEGTDASFGTGRINAYRAVRGDTSPTPPPAGLFSDDLTASGYAHARKLARDASGTLHLAWHGRLGGQYRILYATSSDGGSSWSQPQVVFQSSAETYHPALAIDANYVYIAYPSKAGSSNYQIFFTRKALSGGAWSSPAVLMGGSYNAVRPDLYLDPSNGRLHLVASSYDDAPYAYYMVSDNGGTTWGAVQQVNMASTSGQNTRYAAVHANGSHVYIASRTVEIILLWGILPIPRYRLVTIRSLGAGGIWSDLNELALNDGTEYGAALAGVGDRLYLGYEQGGAIYFRRGDGGVGWSSPANLGSGDWPSLTQGADGQAWLMWESSGSLLLRRYTGTSWDSAETVVQGSSLNKGSYPNLKLGTSGGLVEWTATNCSGAPDRLMYDSRALAAMPTNPSLQFSASDYRVSESAGTATITLALSTAAPRFVTLNYATSNGTATAGSDYTATSGTLTFNPGDTSKTFSVRISEDTRDEPDETVALTLSNLINADLGTPSTATITIGDNDPPPSVALSSSNVSVHENVGSAVVTVRLSTASGYPVTVGYATSNGTATAGSDYTATSGTLTFNPGDTSKTFSVPILEDGLGEANETITLSLSNPGNATLGTPATGSLTINANDTLTFSGSSYSVNENAGSATITVRLNAPSSQPVTVGYATGSGTATAGSDYTATSGTLIFTSGETSKTFPIPITDDTNPEGNETIPLSLSSPTNAVLGTPASATLTINANDTLTFSGSSYTVNENAVMATITVRLNAPSSQPVTVGYATGSGSATAGSDYTATSGTLAFNPGDTSKTFAIPITDDTNPEGNETIPLTLSNPTNAALGTPASATLTINANDTLTFSGSSYSVNENASTATITVRLNSPASQTVTVGYATGSGSATAGSDYTATSGTLSFTPGDTSKTFSVPILEDGLGEGNETIPLSLSNPTNAVLGTPASATLTINANDTLTFSGSSYSVNESAGTATITVRLNAPASQTVTVDYVTSDGTATAGSDYTPASGTLTFSPGETSKTFSVSIINDTIHELSETIMLTLRNPVNAVLGTPASATLTIVDND